MRKYPILNRILSFGLATAMFLSTPASVYATSAEGETVIESTISEENVSENASSESSSAESESSETTSENEFNVSSDDFADNEESNTEDGTVVASDDVASDDGNSIADLDDDTEAIEEDTEESIDNKENAADEEDDETIEYSYKSNGDGTHTKSWTDENGEICEEVEDCSYDENGVCIHCGYEYVEDDSEDEVIELTDENGIVKITAQKSVLNGAVKVTAEEITEESDEEAYSQMSDALDSETGDDVSVVDFVAYDINLWDEDGGPVEPTGDLKVEFTSLDVEGLDDDSLTTEVYHYKDESVSKMEEVSVNNETVEMTTDHFSTYIVAVSGSGNTAVYSSDYVNVADNNSHSWSEGTPSNNGRVVQVRVYIDDALKETSSCAYFWNGKSDKSVEFSVTSVNTLWYSISSVEFASLTEYSQDSLDAVTDEDSSDETLTFTESLTNYKNSNEIGYIDVYLTSNIATVSGATFIDYSSSDFAAGYQRQYYYYPYYYNDYDYFCFNTGNGTYAADICHYGQVYQGLAASSLTDDGEFSLASDIYSQVDLFPTITSTTSQYLAAAYDVDVQFVKDGDYYVLDSSTYGYDLVGTDGYTAEGKVTTGSTLQVKSDTETNGMWPFVTTDIHYGMTVPITFGISSTGMTGEDDTVFEFSGDDDVFVYIDGTLVLDLGGIHDRINASIDFKTGDVTIAANNYDYTSTNGYVYYNKSLGNQNIYTTLNTDLATFSKSEHTMTVVYFERGGNISNCKIKYNFTSVKTTETTDVSFMKLDSNGDALSGAGFTLYAYDSDTETLSDEVANATSSDTGLVEFDGLAVGTYYLKETTVPDGYIDYGAYWILTVAADSTTITAGNDESSSLLGTYSGSVTTTTGQYIKNVESNVKSITINKTWVDVSDDQRPDSLDFYLYATYTDSDNTTYYLLSDGKSSTDKEAYATVTLTSDNVSSTDSNVWSYTIDNLPILVDGDTSKVITWEVEEENLSSYDTYAYDVEYSETAYDATTDIDLGEDDTTTLADALAQADGESSPLYGHIDVKVDAASDSDSALTVEGITDFDGTENAINLIGYYSKSSSWYNTSYTWVQSSKSISYSSYSSYEWRFTNGAYVGANSIIMFKVKFSGDDDYVTVKLTNDSTYPNGTTLYKTTNNSSDFNKIVKYFGLDSSVTSIDLSGMNIFLVSAIACNGSTVSGEGSLTTDGLDLVLSPQTLAANSVSNGTGDETHNITNTLKTCEDPSEYVKYITKDDDGNYYLTLTFKSPVSMTGSESTYASKAKIVDELSEYVTFVESGGFTISVLDSSDNEVGTDNENGTYTYGEYTFTASYSSTDSTYGSVILDLNSDSDYTLGDYTYSVTFQVEPSDAAYSYYAENGSYPTETTTDESGSEVTSVTTGGENTGTTSAGFEGFYSNATAYASYYLGEDRTDTYNKPVIQIDSVYSWQLIKASSSTKNTLQGAEFTLSNDSKTYYGKSVGTDGVVVWYSSEENRADQKDSVVVADGTYTLTETTAPTGYSLSTDTWTVVVSCKNGTTAYMSEDGDLDDQMSSDTENKVITLTFYDDVAYTLPETGGSGVYGFTIGGILLMIAGALLLYKNKNKKR